jgi:hypothetical protein
MELKVEHRTQDQHFNFMISLMDDVIFSVKVLCHLEFMQLNGISMQNMMVTNS